MKPLFILLFSFLYAAAFSQPAGKLATGDEVIDFSLNTIHGNKIQLSDLNKENPVVLVVLRGWPGYQCPICTRQVGNLLGVAEQLADFNAKVLMVYPGPSEKLQAHAHEFSQEFDFPPNFFFALDPDYSMVNKYGLRWDAPKETAYPSTFVIDKNGKVVFVKTSTTHGGRSSTEEIIAALQGLK